MAATPAPRRQQEGNQQGNVLIIFMVIMTVTMLMAVTLGNHYLAVEGTAIEEHLARLRARWAMVGMVDYALSRAMQDGVSNLDDHAKLPLLDDYFDELDGDAGDDDQSMTVSYPELSNNYQFTLTGASALATDNPGNTGRFALTLALTGVGTVPVLAGLNSMPSLVMEACLRGLDVDTQGASECFGKDEHTVWIRAYYWKSE